MDRDAGGAEEVLPAPPSVLERARRLGPLPYSELGGQPSLPWSWLESSRLAQWMAAAIDAWWVELGRPDPYKVVEVGAGDGTRASLVLGLGPDCLNALRYVLVDHGCRDAQAARLPIESPTFLFPGGSEDPEDLDAEGAPRPSPAAGMGPLVTSLEDLPALQGDGVVIAVAWLSRLPSDRVQWRDGRWWEIRLAAVDKGLVELPVPLVDGDLGGSRGQVWSRTRPAHPQEGARYAVLAPASDWISDAFRVAESGVLAVIDVWTATTEPVPPDGRPAMALDQFAPIRRPRDPSARTLFEDLSVVTWRLG
ncbi:MAG TPA: SAM-dependent methyltransferase [Acidimicrobiales bacterium]|nr:SAM-dependent methyltransferase [Acidimicrobiales bacterium]